MPSNPDILTPPPIDISNRFGLWLFNIADQAEQSGDKMLKTKVAYIATVALCITEAVRTTDMDMFQNPLNLHSLASMDPTVTEDGQFQNELLTELGCIATARRWKETHPESETAATVAKDGTNTPLWIHGQLVAEMFFADEGNLPPEENIDIGQTPIFNKIVMETLERVFKSPLTSPLPS